MKDEKLKKLEKELRYLVIDERKKELDAYSNIIEGNVKVEDLAKEIYLKRGIDYNAIKKDGLFNNLGATVSEFGSLFKNKTGDTKKKMIFEIIYMVVLVVLLKVPFDLVRDVGYDYIELLTTNDLLYTLWNLAFLLLYTIVLICTLIYLIRNFNKKYRDMK